MPKEFADWSEVWRTRGKSYNTANEAHPHAREAERQALIGMLAIEPGLTLLEVGPAGGYLSQGIHARFGDGVRILAAEPSDIHAESLPDHMERVPDSDITGFGLPRDSVDRVAALSGLHHTDDTSGFFSESFRVLRPGGVLALSEVRAGSPVDRWLNVIVNDANPDGHDGAFFEQGQMTAALEAAGFEELREELLRYTWDLPSEAELGNYCRMLFGMTRLEPREVIGRIRETLGYATDPDGAVHMNWELLHASGRKPR